MSERQIRIVAKPRQEVDLKKLTRVVIELAKLVEAEAQAAADPETESEAKS
jgi:hypothetical protein